MKVPWLPYVQGAAGKSSTVSKTGIAIHATANPTATAENEAAYAARRTDGIGAHFFFDVDSGVQSCDTLQRVGHAGSTQGNTNAIAVEITGANAWTRQQWIDRVDWPLLGRSLAEVCRAHGIPARWLTVAQMQANPRTTGFYTHDDMRRAWGGTDHTDPGANFPKDVLIKAVSDALSPAVTDGGFLMALTDQEQRNVLEWVALLVDPNTPLTGRPTDIFHFPPLLMTAAKQMPGLVMQVTALTATVQALADAVNSANGDINTAAIFAKIDQAVADVNAQVDEATAAAVAAGQEARDAVGDLAEGGAAQVRADAG
jgi:hypothetical protein